MSSHTRIAALCSLGVIVAACGEPATQPSTGPGVLQSASLAADSVPGVWRWMPSLVPARAALAAAVSDKSVVVVGGYSRRLTDGSAYVLRRVDAFNVETKRWTQLAPLPEPRLRHGATTIGGKIYVAGGITLITDRSNPHYGDPIPHKTLFVYDPVTNTWTRKADMPGPTYESMQAGLLGKLYVYDDPNFWVYTPWTDKWASVPRPPTRHDLGVMGVIDGKLYLTGGLTEAPVNPYATELDVYDPATRTWTIKSPMLRHDAQVPAATFHGKLWVANILSEGRDFTKGGVEVYDPVTDAWKYGPVMLADKRRESTAAWAGGKLFVIGGYGSDGWPSSQVQALITPY